MSAIRHQGKMACDREDITALFRRFRPPQTVPTTQYRNFFVVILVLANPACFISPAISSALYAVMLGILFSQCLSGSPGSLMTAKRPPDFSVRRTSRKQSTISGQK